MGISGENLNKQRMHLLSEYLQQIKSSWPILPSGIWNASSVMRLLRHLSELGRKSRQAGLISITEISNSIDKTITKIHQNSLQPNSEEIGKLNQLLVDLEQLILNIQQQTPVSSSTSRVHNLIYLNKSSPSDSLIIDAIHNNGWHVLSIKSVDDLLTISTLDQVKVILIDTQNIESIDQIKLILERISSTKNHPELVLITPDCDIEVRLEALRTGVTHCFTKPINITDLILSISSFIRPERIAQKRVLVVEDDESQANFATALLAKGGLKTLAITNPLSVLEAVEQFQPDLILMDLYMPGANGIELTQVIREKVELKSIPIVFLSGEDDMEKKLLALFSGADDFLTKPVRPQHLLATVKTRISRAEVVFTAGSRGNIDQLTGLKNRKTLLNTLDYCLQQPPTNQQTHAILSVRFADPEQHKHSEAFNTLLLESIDALRNLLDKDNQLARTSMTSIGILLKRNNPKAVEELSLTLYQQINQIVQKSSAETLDTKFGIGLAFIDHTQEDSDSYLLQAEGASLNAYRQEATSYLTYQLQEESEEASETPDDNQFQLQQFSNALKTKLIEFAEQSFTATDQSGNQLLELTPRPAPATDIVLISDNLFSTAAYHQLSDQLDQYICEYALQLLGNNTMRGIQSQILIPLSAQAIYSDTLIDFIKSELRRLQLVGTGLSIEFNLPALAKDLKKARRFLGEISALGIDTLLGHFACNETAYKVLAYLNAAGVRPHISCMKVDYEAINEIATQIHSLNAKIVLPRVDCFDQVSLHWSEAADYVQSSYTF
jgi:PleD family two-component response regulator/EAL domain-containing protein (putative c-di-GMP-specific phosphodiesterase class I)